MRKRLLILYFVGHLLLILFQAFWATLDGYWNYHFDERPHIPVLNLSKQNKYTEPYHVFTGTNTGYGFYGIHASTNKYLRATFLDSTDQVLKTDRYFNLSSTNGISRLGGYASFLANYIADTKELIDLDTISMDNSQDIEQLRKTYQFKKDYIEKVLKWHGKQQATLVPGCTSYKIELLTIVPENIWQRERKTKPNLYVIQEGIFPVQ